MAKTNRVLVLITDNVPDREGQVFDPKGIELPNVEVPVQYNFGRTFDDLLGYATLERGEDGNVYAVIDFRGPNTQVDRLANLTPAIGGTVFSMSKVFGNTVIDHCRITSIGCSSSKNADPRIPTLGAQRAFHEAPRNPCAEVYVAPGTDVAR